MKSKTNKTKNSKINSKEKRIVKNKYEFTVIAIFIVAVTASLYGQQVRNGPITGFAPFKTDLGDQTGGSNVVVSIPVVTVIEKSTQPTTQTLINITASASDANGIKSINIYIDGGKLIWTCLYSDTPNYATCVNGSLYTAGIHSYYAAATNSIGIKAYSSVSSFTIYNNVAQLGSPSYSPPAPPADTKATVNYMYPPVIMPVESANILNAYIYHWPTNPKNGGQVYLIANASKTANVIRVYLDDVNVKTCKTSPCVYYFNFSKPSYTYYVTASDKTGKVSRDPVSGLKTIGATTPPINVTNPIVVSILTPSDRSTTYNSSVTIRVATNKNAVCSYALIGCNMTNSNDIGTCYSTPKTTMNVTGGTYHIQTAYDIKYNYQYSVNIWCNGALGNSGYAYLIFYSKADYEGPAVSIFHYPNYPIFGQTVTLNATAYDNVALQRIEIGVDSYLVKTCYLSPCIYTFKPNSIGTHSYIARAFDIFQNSRPSEPKTFTVTSAPNNTNTTDTQKPFVYVWHYPSNPVYGDQYASIIVNATDNVAVRFINIYIDGSFVNQCFSSSYCFYPIGNLSVGLHTYYATATDTSSNTARDPLYGYKNFTISIANPALMTYAQSASANSAVTTTSTVHAPWVNFDFYGKPGHLIYGDAVNISAYDQWEEKPSSISIYFDDKSLVKCSNTLGCRGEVKNLLEGIHTYYAILQYSDGKILRYPEKGFKLLYVFKDLSDENDLVYTYPQNPSVGNTVSIGIALQMASGDYHLILDNKNVFTPYCPDGSIYMCLYNTYQATNLSAGWHTYDVYGLSGTFFVSSAGGGGISKTTSDTGGPV